MNGKRENPEVDDLSAASARVLENLAELEPELVSAGIFDSVRKPIAVSSEAEGWTRQASDLLDALESGSGDEAFDSAHVASAEGEVFVVSESGLFLVAVTGRFVLASLTSYDMRMALRDAAASGAVKPSPEGEKGGPENA